MSTQPDKMMTVDEFLAWVEDAPERYELVDGRICVMSPEVVSHAKAKVTMYMALARGIRQAGLPCHAVPDGVALRINQNTYFQPDGQVYCGEELSEDDREVPNPVIVIEVLSPSTFRTDTNTKVTHYLSLPSVHHYVVVSTRQRMMIYHARGDGDVHTTRIVPYGEMLAFNPPGFSIRFPEE